MDTETIILTGVTALAILYFSMDFFNQGRIKEQNESGTGETGMNTVDMQVTEYKDPGPKEARHMFDFSEMGLNYGMLKPSDLAVTNINDAYKPWTAPRQTPTNSLPEIFQDRAKTQAYLEATATPFYFNQKNGEMVLSTSQNSAPLVEIPGPQSIKGDRGSSLAHYPRVYFSSGDELKKKTSERYDRMLNAGMPTESEVRHVPLEGVLNREQNPWGPGGSLQSLFNRSGERVTREMGTNRSTLLAPVLSGRFY